MAGKGWFWLVRAGKGWSVPTQWGGSGGAELAPTAYDPWAQGSADLHFLLFRNIVLYVFGPFRNLRIQFFRPFRNLRIQILAVSEPTYSNLGLRIQIWADVFKYFGRSMLPKGGVEDSPCSGFVGGLHSRAEVHGREAAAANCLLGVA